MELIKLLRKNECVHFCPSLARTQLKCLKLSNQLRDYAKKPKKPATEYKCFSYENASKHCPAYGKECRKCGKTNHFQGECRQHKLVREASTGCCL